MSRVRFCLLVCISKKRNWIITREKKATSRNSRSKQVNCSDGRFWLYYYFNVVPRTRVLIHVKYYRKYILYNKPQSKYDKFQILITNIIRCFIPKCNLRFICCVRANGIHVMTVTNNHTHTTNYITYYVWSPRSHHSTNSRDRSVRTTGQQHQQHNNKKPENFIPILSRVSDI